MNYNFVSRKLSKDILRRTYPVNCNSLRQKTGTCSVQEIQDEIHDPAHEKGEDRDEGKHQH